MLPFEWLASAYFAGLLVATPWTAAARHRRLVVMLSCAALVLLIGIGAPRTSAWLRAWLPHAYLVLGYWMPALLVPPPSRATRFEQWLLRTDEAVRPRLPRIPGWLVPLVELAYLVCYPLVPVSFVIVWVGGDAADVRRFWIAVLAAGYACYGSLPWLVSRPPRLATPSAIGPPAGLGAANALVLRRASHQLNTFPSGHVAVACAAAGVVTTVSVEAGLGVGAVAAAIGVGATIGRYHYVIDVALGAVVGAGALALAATAR